MRAKFPDKDGNLKKLRLGKYIAQAAHASISFLTNKIKNAQTHQVQYIGDSGYTTHKISVPEPLTPEEEQWLKDGFTKICLYVDTESELLHVYNQAKQAGLNVHLIKDSGLTEFDGVPTITCLAIGPHSKSKIDPITEKLRLF